MSAKDAPRAATATLVAAAATRAVPLLLYVGTFGVVLINNLSRPEHTIWPPAWVWIMFGAVPLAAAVVGWTADPRPHELTSLIRVVAVMQAFVPGLVFAGAGTQYVAVLAMSVVAVLLTFAWPPRPGDPAPPRRRPGSRGR